jgi:hypothetical protein
MKILTSSAVNLPSNDVSFTGLASEEWYRLAPHVQPHKMCSGLNPEYLSDEIGITALLRDVVVPRTQDAPLYRDASAGQVPCAEVASGGKVGPVYIYRHSLLLR